MCRHRMFLNVTSVNVPGLYASILPDIHRRKQHRVSDYPGVIGPKAVRIIAIQANSITVCNYS